MRRADTKQIRDAGKRDIEDAKSGRKEKQPILLLSPLFALRYIVTQDYSAGAFLSFSLLVRSNPATTL